MPGDSISTFLDITATGAMPRPQPVENTDVVRRAEALAEIADGVTSLDKLNARTDLSKTAVREAVQWLSENGLVEIRIVDSGDTELGLTPAAEKALE